MEDLEIRLDDIDQQSFSHSRFMVIGKILADRTLNRGGVLRILKGIWQDEIRCVRKVGEDEGNIYAVSFDSAEGRRRAVFDSPWNVMGFPVHFQIWNGELSANEIDFSFMHFWIQIHGVPPFWLNKGNAEIIGSRLGRLIHVDDRFVINGTTRNFMHIQVEFNMNRPLIVGFWVPRRNGGRLWVDVRYEKLSDFCYICGFVGHTNRGCKKPLVYADMSGSVPKYDSFLRVPALKGMGGPEDSNLVDALRIIENDGLLEVRRVVNLGKCGPEENRDEVQSIFNEASIGSPPSSNDGDKSFWASSSGR